MKALLVGDVHAVVEELDDCKRLMDFVAKVAKAEDVDAIVFMGDQYNTHSVVRVEVMAFWSRTFKKLQGKATIYALVGNHDYAGEGLAEHSLLAHQDQIEVVDYPMLLCPGVKMLPYMSDHTELIRSCNANKDVNTLICHQTFVGAKYDNGFYAPDGIDLDLIPQKAVISGHVHAPQQFSKMTYIGAPRWRSLSDANIDRSIVVFEFDYNGNIVSRKDFDTSQVCRKICAKTDSPDDPIDPETLTTNVDWRIDIKGPQDWIEKRKKELARPGVKVRTISTERATPKVRESEGISTAFSKYVQQYTPKHGTDKNLLTEMAQKRLGF